MQQPVKKLRGFFSAFFACDQMVWAGFLAGWPGLPGNTYHETWSARLAFALQLFVKMPPDVAISVVLYSIGYTLQFGPNILLRSLTPAFMFGAGPSDALYEGPPNVLGDVDAKMEARRMMKEFTPTAKVTYNTHVKKDEANIAVPLTPSLPSSSLENRMKETASYPSPFN